MEECVTVLMKKKKIGDHFLMFEPSEMVEGFVDEFGFIDINGNEYCPIDSPEIMNDDIKEGICYYMSKSMIEQRFGNLKEAEKEFAEKIMEFELKQKAFDEANLQNDKQEKENH